ncbi:hypothetical protein QKW35_20745 [Pontibacterium granulatum]|uniref:hypothetical protein n=1 Tax=Pontibacterium granulatum TaxID=2036029 RepID=UPI00249CC1F6|nr:hypothetical protein [Pontibacterium granulatum]MDI3326813.1 hypothetical protein [Pontibacterium granulatum]
MDEELKLLYVFLATGLVSMSAALSAGAINKLPDEDKPEFAKSRNGLVAVIMSGNYSVLTLLFAMAFGVLKLDWWIPLSCLFISFPVIHVVVLQRLFGDVKNLFIMMPLVIASGFALYYYW